jgi:hypothetical protein
MSVQLLVQNIGLLLADRTLKPNPHLAYQGLDDNGYSVIEVGGDDTRMTAYRIATADVATAPDRLRKKLDALFATENFRTRAGSAELEREINGEFLTWDREKLEFR